VLDEYALEKMAILQKEPKLPKIIHLQRFIRSWLRTTRLRRCVSRIMRMVRLKNILQKFSERAPLQRFFNQYDVVHGKKIERELILKAKQEARDRKLAAGEQISDSSSTKEVKRAEKDELIDNIRRISVQGPQYQIVRRATQIIDPKTFKYMV